MKIKIKYYRTTLSHYISPGLKRGPVYREAAPPFRQQE